MEHTIEFWLPFPPSANRLWRSVRGRVVLDKHYKDWKESAANAVIITQNIRQQPVLGIHQLELRLAQGKRGDADNRIKAVLDLLAQELKFIENDKLCRRASVEWATINHDCLVKLTGEIAYKDQWEFATAIASKQYRR